jgi:hypothetical protein
MSLCLKEYNYNSMYIVSFHLIFNENANALSQRIGVPFVQEMKPKPKDIIIVFGAHECADKLMAIQSSIPLNYIIMQSEQFNAKAFDNKFYIHLLKNNPILDFSKENIRRMGRRGSCKRLRGSSIQITEYCVA